MIRQLGAAIALAAAAFCAGQWRESLAGAARMELADGIAKATLENATARALKAEKALADSHSAIDNDLKSGKANAKTAIDSLRADVRSGAERLSVPTRSCSPAPASGSAATGDPEARAELLPATALELIDIAADGDDAVRELNACVDKYNAVRNGIHP
jgi:hypothetical protein